MENKKAFGLCLSGGGFRATLFHLGVVKFLRDAGLLTEITHIFSVSGGSILAAHLVLHWDKYTGTEDDFENAAEEVIQFIQSDVRGLIIRKWLMSWLWIILRPIFWFFGREDWRITFLLEQKYAKFYRLKDEQGRWIPATLAHLNRHEAENQTAPDLHILSTSVTSGHLCSFDKTGFTFGPDKSQRVKIEGFPISKAVAASSAFPPIFSPVPITGNLIHIEPEILFNTQYLTDGGVFDNLGIRKLRLLQDEEPDLEFEKIFISDAGSSFDAKRDAPFGFIVSLAVRASNLLMMRVGQLEYLDLKRSEENPQEKTPKIANCKVRDSFSRKDGHTLKIEEQRQLESIRTDLNIFNCWEINVLTQHGYAAARKACRDKQFLKESSELPSNPPWMPKSTAEKWGQDNFDEQIKAAKRRGWGLWSLKDINTWLSASSLVIVIVVISSPFLVSTYFAKRFSDATVKSDIAAEEAKSNLNDYIKSAPKNQETATKINDVFGKYKSAYVRITTTNVKTNQNDTASGFLISNDGTILTADYVAQPDSNYSVQLFDGRVFPAKLINQGNSIKLALFKIEDNNYPFLRFSKNEASIETPVVTIGNLNGDSEITAELGKVLSVTDEFIQVKLDKEASFFGKGGEPIINVAGEIVGVYYEPVGKSKSISNCITLAATKTYLGL